MPRLREEEKPGKAGGGSRCPELRCPSEVWEQQGSRRHRVSPPPPEFPRAAPNTLLLGNDSAEPRGEAVGAVADLILTDEG